MVDDNSSLGSPEKNQSPNPDGNASPESDLAMDALAQKVQGSLLLGKTHKFWGTQPVGQF